MLLLLLLLLEMGASGGGGGDNCGSVTTESAVTLFSESVMGVFVINVATSCVVHNILEFLRLLNMGMFTLAGGVVVSVMLRCIAVVFTSTSKGIVSTGEACTASTFLEDDDAITTFEDIAFMTSSEVSMFSSLVVVGAVGKERGDVSFRVCIVPPVAVSEAFVLVASFVVLPLDSSMLLCEEETPHASCNSSCCEGSFESSFSIRKDPFLFPATVATVSLALPW